jgi:hypothetical protein
MNPNDPVFAGMSNGFWQTKKLRFWEGSSPLLGTKFGRGFDSRVHSTQGQDARAGSKRRRHSEDVVGPRGHCQGLSHSKPTLRSVFSGMIFGDVMISINFIRVNLSSCKMDLSEKTRLEL